MTIHKLTGIYFDAKRKTTFTNHMKLITIGPILKTELWDTIL